MKNDLTDAHLNQDVTITLPLRALLNISAIQLPDGARITSIRTNRPNIGDKGLHGIYAGIARADDQGGDHIVEVLEAGDKPMTWQDAMDWAASIGGTLPTRKEQALLFANVPELFEKEAYWSCEQYAGLEGSAWFQHFSYGGQDYGRKLSQLRARAVRRLNLE
jgi:hypothetical protein